MSDSAVVRKFRVGDVVGYLPGKREEAFEYLESLGYEAKDNSESSLIVISTPSGAKEIVEKMHELAQTAEDMKPESNPVHPTHYTECSLECIDVMLAVFGRRAVTDFCILNAFKYMWRYEHKNGLEDLQKAERYLAMATTFQTGDTEHEIRIINMQEELETLMRRANK